MTAVPPAVPVGARCDISAVPRLIATDLDGTLLRADRTLSRRTVRALRAATAHGVMVAFVTGRPVRWLPLLYRQLDGVVGAADTAVRAADTVTNADIPARALLPAVCGNGAVIYDPVADEMLRVNPLLPELVGKLCQRVRRVLPDVHFAVEIEDGRTMLYEAGYVLGSEWDRTTIRMVDSLSELTSAAAVKLLVRAAGRDPDEFTRLVAGCLDGLAEVTHSSLSGLVEISANGATKAAGLAWLCARHGISAADVVAFGDMPNDLPMLAWAGRAVAVANAHPAVLAAADEVTAANNEDGVAAYLENAVLPALKGASGEGR